MVPYLTIMLKFPLMQNSKYIIRPMIGEDIPQVAEIDREAFPGEWMLRSLSSYQRELDNPLARYLAACTTKEMLAKLNQPTAPQLRFFRGLFHSNSILTREKRPLEYIVGFASLWLMANDAHVTSIAVRSEYRGMGIGEALLISGIELAIGLNADVVTLEVRASNQVAQILYRKYGFHVVGKRLRYYSDNGEDALLMNTDSVTSASFQSCFQRLKKDHVQRHKEISSQLV